MSSGTRNDASLYSGMSSAIDRKVAAQRKDSKEESEKLAEKVLPIAEPVLKVITDMKAAVTSVSNVLLDPSLSEEQKLHNMERMKADYELLSKVETNLRKLFKQRGDK